MSKQTAARPTLTSVAHLTERALASLHHADRRVVIGIAGPPGAGKSLLSQALAASTSRRLKERAMALPMDGFHMTNQRLSGLGLADRKGAPETFEAQRFVHKLEELAAARGPVSWPDFNRVMDDPVEDAIVVSSDVKLVFLEGNYLVLDWSPWNQVPRCLAQLWYMGADLGQLRARLVRRQILGGRLRRDAEGHVNRVDMINAQTIERCRRRAGYVFELLPTDPLLHNVPDPATGEIFSLDDAGDGGW